MARSSVATGCHRRVDTVVSWVPGSAQLQSLGGSLHARTRTDRAGLALGSRADGRTHVVGGGHDGLGHRVGGVVEATGDVGPREAGEGARAVAGPRDEGQIVDVDEREAHLARGRSGDCLLYTSPSPRDGLLSRMPSSA